MTWVALCNNANLAEAAISLSMYYIFNKNKKKGKPVSELIKVIYSKSISNSNNTINL